MGRRGAYRWTCTVLFLTALAGVTGAGLGAAAVEAGGSARLSDEAIPLQIDAVPARPAPLLEWGRGGFLDTGPVEPGLTAPTGAVWQPHFMVYGEARSAVQTFDPGGGGGGGQVGEWANRLDLYANLYLTPTERVLFGIRPLDEGGRFSGRTFTPGERWDNAFNGRVRTLFFEGDFGELFPGLDRGDRESWDYGFALGRQPVAFQDGILLNDDIDALGVTRSSLFLAGSSAARVTGLLGWHEIGRGDAVEDRNARLLGIFTALDYDRATVEGDLAYVFSDRASGGDGLFFGAGWTARIGHLNTTLRANTSVSLDRESPALSDGTLLTAQLSSTPAGTHDLVYLNGFWGIDQYTSASRSPEAGGPLGQVGILYEAVGLGHFGSALGNGAADSVGFGLGYQWRLDGERRQVVFEVGGRASTRGDLDPSAALGARFQQAFGRRTILSFGAHGTAHESRPDGFGLRSEIRVKF